jgi:hypothetical protein
VSLVLKPAQEIKHTQHTHICTYALYIHM